jgi:negative regulator of sigma-B (phosphoserine phosphatase)
VNATVAHVSVPKVGEHVNGDAVLVRNDETNLSLFAVIDGLGHGPAAAEASKAAVSCLTNVQLDQPLLMHMQSIHAQLRGTRGAAATVCILRGDRLEVCAVGNVQLTSLFADVPLVLSSGVLGLRVAKFRVCEASLEPGARIALYSDGISSKFRLDDSRRLAPKQACDLTIERYRKKEDDSTILIADLEK